MALGEEKEKYIEEMAVFFEGMGMTKSMGRIFGYVLVCDKAMVDFDELQVELKMSKGSVSMTTKGLAQLNFIEMVSQAGERKTYFRIAKNSFSDLIRKRNNILKMFETQLKKALEVKENKKDETANWIADTASFYNWIGVETLKMLEKWESNNSK
jgi:DNA-binding transcriptional regulator GbsR (MarR family)